MLLTTNGLTSCRGAAVANLARSRSGQHATTKLAETSISACAVAHLLVQAIGQKRAEQTIGCAAGDGEHKNDQGHHADDEAASESARQEPPGPARLRLLVDGRRRRINRRLAGRHFVTQVRGAENVAVARPLWLDELGIGVERVTRRAHLDRVEVA